MCPFRVLVILFSLLIALFATMVALAKDPEEEGQQDGTTAAAGGANGEKVAPKTFWSLFVDFWTGRYLYRETKRLMPFFFSKDEAGEEEAATMSMEEIEQLANGGSVDATPSGEAEEEKAASAGEAGVSASLPEPSAPEADEHAIAAPGGAGSATAEGAFARALSKRQQAARVVDAGIVGVIS